MRFCSLPISTRYRRFITSFLNAVDIDPYVMYIIAGYAIVGALFGLFGGSISIGKYLNNEGENAVA